WDWAAETEFPARPTPPSTPAAARATAPTATPATVLLRRRPKRFRLLKEPPYWIGAEPCSELSRCPRRRGLAFCSPDGEESRPLARLDEYPIAIRSDHKEAPWQLSASRASSCTAR